mmetsp:Transcript_11529/g.32087  ORF Transcript_11529/g.32087 Transcript_11529/m.32087 type:complete len:233 (+) Transcript_11529:225-923(+)
MCQHERLGHQRLLLFGAARHVTEELWTRFACSSLQKASECVAGTGGCCPETRRLWEWCRRNRGGNRGSAQHAMPCLGHWCRTRGPACGCGGAAPGPRCRDCGEAEQLQSGEHSHAVAWHLGGSQQLGRTRVLASTVGPRSDGADGGRGSSSRECRCAGGLGARVSRSLAHGHSRDSACAPEDGAAPGRSGSVRCRIRRCPRAVRRSQLRQLRGRLFQGCYSTSFISSSAHRM